MTFLKRLLRLCAAIPLLSAAAAPAPLLQEKGIVLDNGAMGKFLFEYPTYVSAGGDVAKPVVKLADGCAVVTFPLQGAPEIAVTLDGNRLRSVMKTGNGGRVIWKMYVSMNLAGHATYRIDSGGAVLLPAEQPARPHLIQANGKSFELFDKQSDSALKITGGTSCFWELQDNRAWNWKIFFLKCSVAVKGNDPAQKVDFGFLLTQPEKVKVRVDRFGQPMELDFPGKIRSGEELKADLVADRDYYASLTPPGRTAWGGMPGSAEKYGLRGTGFFRLDKVNGRDVLVTPDGDIFFQLGVCSVSPGDDYTCTRGRENIYEWLPPRQGEFASAYRNRWETDFSYYLANRIRKTGRPYELTQWKKEFIDRLRRWGFNSEGAFSSPTVALNAAEKFPRTPFVPGMKGLIGEIYDPFDPEVRKAMDEKFRRLRESGDDPTIIGYFFSNEQAYGEVSRRIPAMKGNVAAKRELVAALRKKYGSVEAFNRAWKCDAASFDELNDRELQLTAREAYEDAEAFAEHFFEEYFKLLGTTFRKYDRNHLLIGTRFLNSHGNLEKVVAACGRYCDVFSINYYTRSIDRAFLDRIHKAAGRPLLLSEWSFGTGEQGLAGGVIDTAGQKERGEAYRNYVENAAALPYVIGHQWFACLDQALTGRYFQHYNGESQNIGLVNVADRPFKEFLAEVMKTNGRIYEVMLGEAEPFVSSSLASGTGRGGRSLTIPRALPGHRVDGFKDPWPGRPAERLDGSTLVQGNPQGGVSADFWCCFDDRKLYCYVEVADPTPMRNKWKNGDLWQGDCIELFIGAEKLEQNGSLLFSDRHLLISAAPGGGSWLVGEQKPAGLDVVTKPGANGYTMEIGIPWTLLGVEPATGVKFRFDLGVDNSDGTRRLQQLIWSGTAANSSDRTGWGSATLVD
ncbi:MAG: hypothetical protein HPZ91_13195 [Lentisphaeria bacterium]|nr:hypothetical protein [Lentisphaeria bacterium]